MMRRTYKFLLGLYPWDYRSAFEAEMLSAFENAATNPATGKLRFAAKEATGLVIGVCREWLAKLTTDPVVRGRALPDIRMMRPPGIPREVWFRST